MNEKIDGIIRTGMSDSLYDMPLDVVWLPTMRCNYRCSYCGLTKQTSRDYLPLDKVKAMWNNLLRLNRPYYLFGILGGEPTVYPYLASSIEYLYEILNSKLRRIFITSNGSSNYPLYKSLTVLAREKLPLQLFISLHTEFIDMKHIKHLIEQLSHYSWIEFHLMFNCQKRSLVHNIFDTLCSLRNEYPFILKINYIYKCGKIDPEYNNDDFTWRDNSIAMFNSVAASSPHKMKFRGIFPVQNNFVSAYSCNDGYIFKKSIDYYEEYKSGLYDLKGYYCSTGTTMFQINPDASVAAAAQCNLASIASKPLYDMLPYDDPNFVKLVKCTRDNCDCPANNNLIKFRAKDEGELYLNHFHIKNNRLIQDYQNSLSDSLEQFHRIENNKLAVNMQNCLVDENYYYSQYPDVKNSGLSAANHYSQYGWLEGRNPNKWFNTNFYLSKYMKNCNIPTNVTPLTFYITYGLSHGHLPNDTGIEPVIKNASGANVTLANVNSSSDSLCKLLYDILLKIDQWQPGSEEIFNKIIKMRPDIKSLFNEELSIEQNTFILLMWAWIHGIKENNYVKWHANKIKNLFFNLYLMKCSAFDGSEMSYLIFLIFQIRPDLHEAITATSDKTKLLSYWFHKFGIMEYGFNEVLNKNIDFIAINNRDDICKISYNESLPTIALWGTTDPRSNIEMLNSLYVKLLADSKFNLLFFCKNNSVSHLRDNSYDFPQKIYLLDESKLFNYMNFINILVTSDYVPRDNPILSFNGKIVMLPHNFNVTNPNSYNVYADYFISTNFPAAPLIDYSYMPNSLKYHGNAVNKSYIIGGLYPKLEVLRQRLASKTTDNRIYIFYIAHAIDYVCECDVNKRRMVVERLEKLFMDIIANYPEAFLVYRPKYHDRFKTDIQNMVIRLSEYDNFIYDDDDDNTFWITHSSYVITDYSTVDFNYCLSTLSPILYFKYLNNEDTPPYQDSYGFSCHSFKQLADAMSDIKFNKNKYTRHLLDLRIKKLKHLDGIEYLHKHINYILNGCTTEEWFSIDKGDLCTRTKSENIICIAKLLKSEFYKSVTATILYEWIKQYSNYDICYLLLIKAVVVTYNNLINYNQTIFFTYDIVIRNIIQLKSNQLILNMIKWLIKKYPDSPATTKFLIPSLEIS